MKHGRKSLPTVLAYVVLTAAAITSLSLPTSLTIPQARASTPPNKISLTGVVYDFNASHADFDVVPAGGNGHYAGNLATQLDESLRPEFIGRGSIEAAAAFSAPPPWSGPFGYDTAFGTTAEDVDDKQIATQVTLPTSVVVTGLTAYVGEDSHKVRYAIYTDVTGQPGTLIAQTGTAQSNNYSMQWLHIPLIAQTQLAAGTYWLALCLEDEEQRYAYSGTGGVSRVKNQDAVASSFLATWGTSTSSGTQRISIYAAVETDMQIFGNTVAETTLTSNVADKQVATQFNLAQAGTLLAITARVGNNDEDVRFAIYSDAAGEPGSVLAQSFSDETSNSMGWVTLFVPDTQLAAGNYWLALSLDSSSQAFAANAAGGTTRYRSHDANTNGFRTPWGTSSSSTAQKLAIYALVHTEEEVIVPNGFKITSEWHDAQSRPIVPPLFGAGSDNSIDFEIVSQAVIPDDEFAVEVRVLGSAIQTGAGGYHRPVTMRMIVGGSALEPFGPYDDPILGNVNDVQTVTCNSNGTNPRCAVLSGTFPAGTAVGVDGQSWTLMGPTSGGCVAANWRSSMDVSTADNSVQLKVLRNGDAVPDINAMYQQGSAAEYVAPYVDLDTGLMTLGENQIIYLFELGQNGSSSSADFQDLVVLVTLAEDTTGLCGGSGSTSTTLCGSAFGDTEGTATPASEIDASGGISSAASFAEWYSLVLGTNAALLHTIDLIDDGTGVYEMDNSSFFPADDMGLGNEGEAHNHFFTYAVTARFTYEHCGGQFIEFEGDDDFWLFVDRKLAMDLGGMRPGTEQFVSMDRLGLTDGEEYEVKFFYARRQDASAVFHLRTNIDLASGGQGEVSGMFD